MPMPAASTAAAAPSKPLADACPAQLAVKQTVSEPIAGWTSLDQQGSYPFLRVAFYPGPPADGPPGPRVPAPRGLLPKPPNAPSWRIWSYCFRFSASPSV